MVLRQSFPVFDTSLEVIHECAVPLKGREYSFLYRFLISFGYRVLSDSKVLRTKGFRNHPSKGVAPDSFRHLGLYSYESDSDLVLDLVVHEVVTLLK